MEKVTRQILAFCLILAVCLCCGTAAFADGKDADAALKQVRELIDKGKMYDAALACYDGAEDYPDAESDFDKLWDEITEKCEKNLPKTGELTRTFQFQGGNELRMTAVSGHVVMTARDVDSEDYVRFFIRQDENITVYLPAGEYELSFEVGETWFDDKNGFGDFCDSYYYEDNLVFKYTASGGWVTYYAYEDEL